MPVSGYHQQDTAVAREALPNWMICAWLRAESLRVSLADDRGGLIACRYPVPGFSQSTPDHRALPLDHRVCTSQGAQ
jgi:hypothetical protein